MNHPDRFKRVDELVANLQVKRELEDNSEEQQGPSKRLHVSSIYFLNGMFVNKPMFVSLSKCIAWSFYYVLVGNSK